MEESKTKKSEWSTFLFDILANFNLQYNEI